MLLKKCFLLFLFFISSFSVKAQYGTHLRNSIALGLSGSALFVAFKNARLAKSLEEAKKDGETLLGLTKKDTSYARILEDAARNGLDPSNIVIIDDSNMHRPGFQGKRTDRAIGAAGCKISGLSVVDGRFIHQ